MGIPNDPVILLSYLNTQLRDNFSSLDELCKSLGLDEVDLKMRLKAINYEYDREFNRFM